MKRAASSLRVLLTARRLPHRLVPTGRPAPSTAPWLQPCGPTRLFAAGALPPHVKMAMPALSPTMQVGTIIKWHKKPGDSLNPGDLMAEVGTDKATVDFECQDSGYLAKILVGDGTSDVAVGSLIAIMVDNKDAVAAFASTTLESLGGGGAPAAAASPPPAAPAPAPAAAASAAPPPPPSPQPAAARAAPAASGSGRVVASPLAKKLAADAGVSAAQLASVAGTGPGGRVIAADVREAVAAGAFTSATTSTASAPAAAAAAPAAASSSAAAVSAAPAARAGFVDVPHTQMRRVIAHRLTASKQTVPHYTLTADVALDALLALRATLNADLPADGKVSVNDFFIKASALALRKVPEANSSWLESGIRAYDYVDVSVAVAVPDGLVTPIVKDAHHKGLLAISSDVRALAEKARAGKLSPDEYQGGTFTLSNLGMFGVRQFSAIINPPQACILAIGAAERRVVPDAAPGAKLPYRQSVMLSATLSCDHRVVDGAVGAQWLAAFKGFVEAPQTMLL